MRHRLLVVLVGAGVALGGLPAAALPGASAASRPEQEARGVLESAARAGRALTYSGTQYVATWRGGGSAAALVQVAHNPVDGPVVTPAAPAAASDPLAMTSAATLDPRLLGRLASTYDLVLLDAERWAGRPADVVEAQRPLGAVAGRFWVDRVTGLLLRRDVFDEQGSRISSSAFLDVEVADVEVAGAGPPAPQVRPAGAGPEGTPEPLPEAAQRLRSAGWEVPEALPGGFGLFDTRLDAPSPGQEILHLAYSDGLSTVSLFAQVGRLGTEPPEGFTLEQVGGRPVWVRHEAPERAVWSGNGRVWTLVSDAPPAAVLAAVETLPRDPAPRTGLLARLGRGLARLAGMVVASD